MIPIDYMETPWALPKRLTESVLMYLFQQMNTRMTVEAVRAGHTEMKRTLPGICWQATFGGQRRLDRNATPNGLFGLDIDHIEAPYTLWKTFEKRVDELDIVCVHQTPSGKGLRVVALCQPQFDSIAENQAWLAGEIGTTYDATCRDLARLYFVSVAEDLWYLDNDTLFGK